MDVAEWDDNRMNPGDIELCVSQVPGDAGYLLLDGFKSR